MNAEEFRAEALRRLYLDPLTRELTLDIVLSVLVEPLRQMIVERDAHFALLKARVEECEANIDKLADLVIANSAGRK